MKSDFFIDRPIFSIVISIVIVIVGVLGLFLLPIDQYPQIVPPVVKVSASYPGASAQTVTQAVATPIEQELNGTPGMLYMESTNSVLERVQRKASGALSRGVAQLVGRKAVGHLMQHEGRNEAQHRADDVGNANHSA